MNNTRTAYNVERAIREMRAHGHDAYPDPTDPQAVRAQVMVCAGGVWSAVWESVKADRQSVRDWLGY